MQALKGFSPSYLLSIPLICGNVSDQQSNVIATVLDCCFVQPCVILIYSYYNTCLVHSMYIVSVHLDLPHSVGFNY